MTKREILFIKAGGVIVASTMVLAIVTVLLVKYAWPEIEFEKPVDPSSQNLKSTGIALLMYSDDYEGLELPVVGENEKRVYTGPSGQDDTDTGSKAGTDNKNGDRKLVP